MTRRTALARARRGAAFLDTRYKTWRKKINPERLDLAQGTYYPRGVECGCVLAQLDAGFRNSFFGSFSDRSMRLGLSDTEDEKLGFTAEDLNDYPVLTDAWRKVLTEA